MDEKVLEQILEKLKKLDQIDELRQDVKRLYEGQNLLQQEVKQLREGQNTLEKGQHKLEQGQDTLQQEVKQLREGQEEILTNIKYLWEDIKRIDDRFSGQERKIRVLSGDD
ncbi:MAG: hydrolase [Peptococcaceae bacterium]|nr:hydrolase [Peptococcaceae bacterium]